MTETSAKVLLDSLSEAGHRLTTMQVTFHRFVLAEFNTHRKKSRNSASSRAIPVEKMLERFLNDPAFPVAWTSEQPGMQGGTVLTGRDLFDAQEFLSDIHDFTAARTRRYLDEHPDKMTRLHKGLVNRPMEWAQWHTVIVTSTEWQNFFAQRCSPLAQPEIMVAAEAMRAAFEASTPTRLKSGEWHTPLTYDTVTDYELGYIDVPGYDWERRKRVSAARCARVSYLTHDGIRSIEADLGLYGNLATAQPPHWSPMEHVATPCPVGDYEHEHLGNFDGWDQMRHVG